MQRMCHQQIQKQQQINLQNVIQQKISRTIITPEGVCPKCKYELTEREIRQGWLQDPMDYTTKCPKCNERFVAQLKLREQNQDMGVTLYLCQIQLFCILKDLRRGQSKILGKCFLYKKYRGILFNMVRHFGTYEKGLKAFRQWAEN